MSEKWVAFPWQSQNAWYQLVDQCGALLVGQHPAIFKTESQVSNETLPLFPLSAEGSRASQSHVQDSARAQMTNGGSGLSSIDSFASLGPDGSWVKMYQGCSQLLLDGSLEGYCETWPRAGTMRNGTAYRRARLVLTSEVIACMSSPVVPRPVACDGKGSGRIRHERLQNMNLRDWWNVNCRFVYPPARTTEYLMGFPLGWTDLKDSATPSSPRSPNGSDGES